ncbi:MAG: hypothetical protein ACJAZW_000267 [Maritalea sp.]|jgi:hypothetical protein
MLFWSNGFLGVTWQGAVKSCSRNGVLAHVDVIFDSCVWPYDRQLVCDLCWGTAFMERILEFSQLSDQYSSVGKASQIAHLLKF